MGLIVRGQPRMAKETAGMPFHMPSPGTYPAAVSADWVIHYIADLNDCEDPYEGPEPERVSAYAGFRLECVRLSATDVLEHDASPISSGITPP